MSLISLFPLPKKMRKMIQILSFHWQPAAHTTFAAVPLFLLLLIDGNGAFVVIREKSLEQKQKKRKNSPRDTEVSDKTRRFKEVLTAKFGGVLLAINRGMTLVNYCPEEIFLRNGFSFIVIGQEIS